MAATPGRVTAARVRVRSSSDDGRIVGIWMVGFWGSEQPVSDARWRNDRPRSRGLRLPVFEPELGTPVRRARECGRLVAVQGDAPGGLRVDAKIDSVFITWVRWCSSTWAGRCSV